MKAVVWTKYGPPEVLQLQDAAKPEPRDKEVLIRVHAASVTMGDCELRSLKLPGRLRLPMRVYAGLFLPKRIRVLGQGLAGQVESVGAGVTKFKPGDRVFAAAGFSSGAYAEYVCMPEEPVGDGRGDCVYAGKPVLSGSRRRPGCVTGYSLSPE